MAGWGSLLIFNMLFCFASPSVFIANNPSMVSILQAETLESHSKKNIQKNIDFYRQFPCKASPHLKRLGSYILRIFFNSSASPIHKIIKTQNRTKTHCSLSHTTQQSESTFTFFCTLTIKRYYSTARCGSALALIMWM